MTNGAKGGNGGVMPPQIVKMIEVANKVAGFLGLLVAGFLAVDKALEENRIANAWDNNKHFQRRVSEIATQTLQTQTNKIFLRSIADDALNDRQLATKEDVKRVEKAIDHLRDEWGPVSRALLKRGILD